GGVPVCESAGRHGDCTRHRPYCKLPEIRRIAFYRAFAMLSQRGFAMNAAAMGRWLLLGAGMLAAMNGLAQEEAKKVRLFILSGQSNMVGLKPEVSFTPTVKKAFPDDEVIVVHSAKGGEPIRRWYRDWKPAPGAESSKLKGSNGDLYEVLMEKVK